MSNVIHPLGQQITAPYLLTWDVLSAHYVLVSDRGILYKTTWASGYCGSHVIWRKYCTGGEICSSDPYDTVRNCAGKNRRNSLHMTSTDVGDPLSELSRQVETSMSSRAELSWHR